MRKHLSKDRLNAIVMALNDFSDPLNRAEEKPSDHALHSIGVDLLAEIYALQAERDEWMKRTWRQIRITELILDNSNLYEFLTDDEAETPEEAEAYLRSQGYEPEEMLERLKTRMKKAMDESPYNPKNHTQDI